MVDVLLITLTGVVSSLLTIILLYILYFRKFSEQVDHQVEATNKISDMGVNFTTQVNQVKQSLDSQMQELRELQTQLSNEQRETQDLISKFTQIVTLKPTVRGQVGEGIVKWALGLLPERWWSEQVTIEGGRVDFVVTLSDDHELYIDSKFSFPDKMMDLDDLTYLDEEVRTDLNKRAIDRSKELSKYIEGNNAKNIGFVLMYLPGVVYANLNDGTYSSIYKNRVVPVDNSGLLATILIVRRMIRMIQFEKAQDRILAIRDQIPAVFEEMRGEMKTLKGHIQRASKKFVEVNNLVDESEIELLKTFMELEASTGKLDSED